MLGMVFKAMPRDGDRSDSLSDLIADPAPRNRVLVDNAGSLYGIVD